MTDPKCITRPRRKVLVDVSTPEGYDIICGFRGPDVGGRFSTLKWILTARIRHLTLRRLGGRCRGDVRTGKISLDEAWRTIDEVGAQRAQKPDSLNHYLLHAQKAALALGDTDLAKLARLLRDADFRHVSTEEVVKLTGGR